MTQRQGSAQGWTPEVISLSQTAEVYIQAAAIFPPSAGADDQYFAPSSRAAGLSLRKGQSASLDRCASDGRFTHGQLISVGTKK